MHGIAAGALVCSVFGGVWGIAGSSGLPGRARTPVMAIAAAIALLLVVFVLARPIPAVEAVSFDGHIYGIAVAGEVVAIAIAVAVLRWRRRRDLILPAVGVIVGLHFIGMWKAFEMPLFLAVAFAMSAVSLFAFALPGTNARGFSARQSVSGFGCAAVLWIAALTVH